MVKVNCCGLSMVDGKEKLKAVGWQMEAVVFFSTVEGEEKPMEMHWGQQRETMMGPT